MVLPHFTLYTALLCTSIIIFNQGDDRRRSCSSGSTVEVNVSFSDLDAFFAVITCYLPGKIGTKTYHFHFTQNAIYTNA